MQFSLTWYMLLRSVLDHCWFGNASASILLVVSLRLCISQLFCPDLACIHNFRPGQWTLSCTAAKRGTTSTLIQMSHHSQLMEILVFLSIQMLHYFFNSLLCYKSNPIVLRAVQTQKVEEKKVKKPYPKCCDLLPNPGILHLLQSIFIPFSSLLTRTF